MVSVCIQAQGDRGKGYWVLGVGPFTSLPSSRIKLCNQLFSSGLTTTVDVNYSVFNRLTITGVFHCCGFDVVLLCVVVVVVDGVNNGCIDL